MELNVSLLLSSFAIGLFIGIVADLINIFISAFSRWVLSW